MGGSGGGGQNYDPVLNAGILALSEAGFDISKEYDNFYRYGVLYDPNEEGYVDPKTKEWVPLSEAPMMEAGFGSNKQQFPAIPSGAKVSTRGAVEGFDFENPPQSYMSMEQGQISANNQMLPSATQASIAQNRAETTASDTQTWQSLVDRGLTTGINPITGEQVGPGALQVGSAQQSRDIAMYGADERNIPYSEQAAREGYLTQGAQSQSDRALIPYSQQNAIERYKTDTRQAISDKSLIMDREGADRSGYQYQTAMNQAQQGLISPWVQSVLSDYNYNVEKNRTESALLPGYQKATQSGYDLTYGKNTADQALLPYYQRAEQAGYEASEAGSQYSTGKSRADISLLPAYQKAAQADYDLSYDTSQYGRQKIAGQTPIMNRYFDEVNKGIDVGGRVNEASADVASSWKGANQRTNMALEGMGIDPSSNRGRDAFSKSNMEYGRQQTSARQAARRQAEDEDFNRMSTAISM